MTESKQGSNNKLQLAYFKKNDQGRSLSCVHHEGVVWDTTCEGSELLIVRPVSWADDLDRPDHLLHTGFWAHTLAAYPTIHLSKSVQQTAVATFVFRAVIPNLAISLRLMSRSGEAEYYRRFRWCQPVSKRFLTVSFRHQNFALTLLRVGGYIPTTKPCQGPFSVRRVDKNKRDKLSFLTFARLKALPRFQGCCTGNKRLELANRRSLSTAAKSSRGHNQLNEGSLCQPLNDPSSATN